MHDIDDAKLIDIRTRGGVDVEGGPQAFAPVDLASTDLRAVIDGAELIIVCSGGNTQETVARTLAPLLRDGQLILLIQGNTGGALVVRRALREAGCRAAVDVAEMDNYPYSVSRLAPARLRPIVAKRWLQIAAFPGSRGPAVFARLSRLFPQAVAARDVLHTGLTNMNSILHVANCVANAASIEAGKSYKFYAEGVTPAVARLYEAIDSERLAVAAAFEAAVPSLADWWELAYGVREATLCESAQRLTFDAMGPYQATGTPKSLDHKFIAEDVPTGLSPLRALARAARVGTPTLDALLVIVDRMTGKTFEQEGRTLERLGLSGMNAAGIRKTVQDGFPC